MALPGNISTRVVQGRYIDLLGNVVAGEVHFSIDAVFSDTAAQVVIIGSGMPVIGELDATGFFSVTLPSLDDVDLSPTGYRCKVEEKFLNGLNGRTYYIDVLGASVDPIDISGVVLATGPAVGSTTFIPLSEKATANGVTPLGADSKIPLAYFPVLPPPASQKIINVMDAPYNAKGDDSNDDSVAIRAAIAACNQGDVVYCPPARYRFGSPVVLSLGVTLRFGGWSPHFAPRTNMIHSYIRPGIGNFNGNELIRVEPAPVNGTYLDSAYGGGPRIEGLAANGKGMQLNQTGGAITGIRVMPGVKDVQVKNSTLWQLSGDAFYADQGAGMRLENVVTSTNAGVGVKMITTGASGGATDVDLLDVYSQGNTTGGFILQNPNALSMRGCRAEFDSEDGYLFTGTNYSSVIIGCNTDRSAKHGFNFQCLDGGKPFLLIGCQAKRDGGAGGTYVGFNFQGVDAATQAPGGSLVNCSSYVGRNDDNSGPRGPQYAVQTNFTHRVTVSGGYLEGTLAAYNDLSVALNKTAGIVQVVIDPTTGASTISNGDRTTINGVAGSTRALQFLSRGLGERWEVRTNSTAETGSNAGSNFEVGRFDDTGAQVDSPLTINRATGGVSILKALSSDGPALGSPSPANSNGYVAWTSDPWIAPTAASAATLGTLLLVTIPVARSTSITKGYVFLSTAATTPTAASNWMVAFDQLGNLVSMVDITSKVATAGLLIADLPSFASTPQNYRMGLLFNAAVAPQPSRASTALIAAINGNLSTANLRVCNNGAGLTTPPNPLVLASNSQSNAYPFWAAFG